MPKNTILRIILLSCMYATQLVYGQSSCSSSPCPSLHLCVPLADTSYRCICIDPSCFQRVETTTPTIQGGNIIHLFHLKQNVHQWYILRTEYKSC